MLFDQPREWDHLLRMLNTPGWQDQAKRRADQLQRSGLWDGAPQAVMAEIQRQSGKSSGAVQKSGG